MSTSVFLAVGVHDMALAGTMLFSTLSFFGLFHQIRQIVKLKTVRSILPSLYIINAFVYFTGLIYGYAQADWAIFFNGLLIFPYLILHHILYRMRAFNRIDITLMLSFSLLVAFMLVTKHYGPVYFALIIASILGYCGQLIILFRSGVVAALSPYIFIVGFLSSATWTVYAFLSKETVLMYTAPAYLVLNVSIVILWCLFWYRQNHTNIGSVPSTYKQN